MQKISKKLVLLGTDNPTTWIVYNHLVQRFGLFPAVIENPASRLQLLKNRVRKLGIFAVLDQLGFILALRPIIVRRDQQRIRDICHDQGLEMFEPTTPAIQHVESVNSDACRAVLGALKPDIIIVNGTRIIGKKTLEAANATIINTHHGITPAYRGAHGAYWALYQSDPENCGVTVHLVDEGIDTGNIIAQAKVETTKADSFATYPYLQTATALPILTTALEDAIAGQLQTRAVSGQSAVWYHPGFFQYLSGLWRGVH